VVTTDSAIIREVGLRDGLQIISSIMPTDDKRMWCTGAADAGFVEIEATSLVPPEYLPQFADAAEVIAHVKTLPNVVGSALVPNLRGAIRAAELGVSKITYIVSASESFNRANVRRSRQESIDELHRIIDLRDNARFQVIGGISSAFGCGIEGPIDIAEVARIAEMLLDIGVDELAVADTVGYGEPAGVRRLLAVLLPLAGGVPVSAHFHDTRGTGIANVLAALDHGVRRFDASLGGIGGCPNAVGATGNIATEDLVYLLEAMGLDSGIDLERVIELRRQVAQLLPGVPMYGHMVQAGLPTGFPTRTHATAQQAGAQR
jgi:hydroxymethylglutaryl-CoA lyase